MPTLVGMRRRGYPAAAIRDFIERVGVAKADTVVDGASARTLRARGLWATARRARWPCSSPSR